MRSISATRRFVSRFMPAKRPSRFSSRRISRRSRRNVGALLLSTFPATCSAKPPPQRLDVPRSLVCILDVMGNFGTPVPDPPHPVRHFDPMLRWRHLRHRLSAKCLWHHEVLKRNRTDACGVCHIGRSNGFSPGPDRPLAKPRFPPPGFLPFQRRSPVTAISAWRLPQRKQSGRGLRKRRRFCLG
jgi:hypothetical protein